MTHAWCQAASGRTVFMSFFHMALLLGTSELSLYGALPIWLNSVSVARCRRGWTLWRRRARKAPGLSHRASCPCANSRGQSRMRPPAAPQVWRMSCTNDVCTCHPAPLTAMRSSACN